MDRVTVAKQDKNGFFYVKNADYKTTVCLLVDVASLVVKLEMWWVWNPIKN